MQTIIYKWLSVYWDIEVIVNFFINFRAAFMSYTIYTYELAILSSCANVCSVNTTGNTFKPWWRHQMEAFSALPTLRVGNSSVNSPHKGQWRGALMFSLICAWINGWVNNREAGDWRHHRTHYDVTVMIHEDGIPWDIFYSGCPC